MNIASKSTAELINQFIAIEPSEIELGPDKNERYIEAYVAVADAINRDNQGAVIANVALAAAMNEDILRDRSPFGYVNAMRAMRRKTERAFAGTLKTVSKKSTIDTVKRHEHKQMLEENTLQISTPNQLDGILRDKLFPSGNYFLHATDTDSILGILEEGVIKSTISFATDEQRAKKSNGGAFGVAGNYNEVTNILGEPGHLAGFIADPLVVLQEQGGYFTPPSKSCWNELQYYPSHENPLHVMQLRDAETHIETASAALAMFDMTQAVLSGDGEHFYDAPPEFILKAEFQNSMKLLQDNPALLMRAYRRVANGDFRFTEMLGHDGEPISPLHILIAAAVEGAFGDNIAHKLTENGLSFDKTTLEIIKPAIMQLADQTETLYKKIEGDIGASSAIKVENTLFYCPAKDYNLWLEVLAAMPHRPKGIVVYDNKEVRVPAAFALAFPDNGRESLSNQLAILKNEQTIDWISLFDELPQASLRTSYLVRPRETNLAGVLKLNEAGQLTSFSLDDLDEDDE